MRTVLIAASLLLLLAGVAVAQQASPLLQAMQTELDRSFAALRFAEETPLYYLSYRVTDTERHDISASYGAISDDNRSHDRNLNIDCRVGDYQLDNTHEIRGEYSSGGSGPSPNLPLDNDELAIRTVIWRATDQAYRDALESYTKVLTNDQVLVEKEDTSADFSHEQPHQYVGAEVAASFDSEDWKPRLRRISAIFKEYPFVETSSLQISLTNDNRYFVDSDGAKIQTGQSYARLFVRCSGTAEDGMQIDRYESFDAATPAGLPDDATIEAAAKRLIAELEALLTAPLAEPYTGPAILVNRAAGVFFHEIFGHRIEGHRQKSEFEGQTFTRKVNEQILPEFMSIYDDPTMPEFEGQFLRGFYRYDDQGVETERVPVVENGVLRNFLMSRSPIANFPKSNGHGRAQAGRDVVSRQGNLLITSTNEYDFETLKEKLLDECRSQGKPYGLIFYDISGGFTMTGRYSPQSFKVIPLLVYRVYTDGREPEVIRGVDIVGTPLTSFARITATGNDYGIFNGTCGAESGWVPVSAIAPSVLVSEVEIEKKAKE
ncbi:MAG: metallopeptidase TldD-related protein, partial [bacterium]